MQVISLLKPADGQWYFSKGYIAFKLLYCIVEINIPKMHFDTGMMPSENAQIVTLR